MSRRLPGARLSGRIRYLSATAWKAGPAKRLDTLLRDAKLSSAELAREMKLSQSLISRFRRGSRVPKADQLAYMIARAKGSADEVLGLASTQRARQEAVALKAQVDRLLEALAVRR